MAIPNTQRDAIEALIAKTEPTPIDLRKLDRIELDGRPLHLCGVSDGYGSHSRSRARIAVFAYGESTSSSPVPVRPCDAAVLLRAPTDAERAAWPSNTALHALDALAIDLTDDRAVAHKTTHSTTYVPL